MSAETIQEYFRGKIERLDFSGIEGARLKFHIPVQETFLNFVLDSMISHPEKMNDFKEIHFSDMNNEEFVLKIDHKMIDRNLRCKIHDVEYNNHYERTVKIEFLDGIRFYEKALLSIFGKAKSGWSSLKNALTSGHDDDGTFWKISGSKVKINLDALLRKQGLSFLIPLVDLKGITTKNNSIVIDFELKTIQHESNYPANH